MLRRKPDILSGVSIVGVQHLDLNSSTYLTDLLIFSGVTFSTVGWTANKTATVRFYFGKNSSNSYTELASIPNISTYNVTMTYNAAAKLRSFKTGAGYITPLLTGYTLTFSSTGASGWSNLETHRTNNYVTQGTTGTVTLSWYGCDLNTSGDGIGDLNIVQAANRTYWYRKNSNTFALLAAISPDPVTNGSEGVSNLSLGEALTWGDVSRNYKCTEIGKLECTENGNNSAQLLCFQM